MGLGALPAWKRKFEVKIRILIPASGPGGGVMDQYRDWQELLRSSYDEFVTTLGAFLPGLLRAAILMLAGMLLAWLLKWSIVRVGKGLDTLASRFGIGTVMRLRWPLSDVLAGTAYWLVILFFATAAAESLGMPGLADWLGKLIAYLPTLLGALLIIGAGFLAGGMARDRIVSNASRSGLAQAQVAGGLVRAVVVVLTVVVGVSHLGLEIRLIEHLLTIIAAAALGAFALAFGLGAGPSVSNIIALRNVKRHYSVGQHVRVGDVEGTILELSSAFVVLDTDRGRTLVPAKVFEQEISELLDGEAGDER